MNLSRLIHIFLPLVTVCVVANKPNHGTMVHLFEWKWADIALECEEYLGPLGYKAVQISPPSEHISGQQWWTRYQPVSYKLISRGGTRAELRDMIKRCAAVGVDIYADAVINHMAAVGSGTGIAGSKYTPYKYDGVPYGPLGFHYCRESGNRGIRNYNDAYEVRNCELVGLADLAMEKDYVRGKIAGYLNDLLSVGVKGFRYDASKHMEPRDIAAVNSRLNNPAYVFQEVIGQPGEPITPKEYFGSGDVTEFRYGIELNNNFRDAGKVKYLRNFGTSFGLMPSNKAVVFLENHDNERGHGGGGNVLTYRDGQVYELAAAFMLAWPYGYPKVMSSYDIGDDSEKGPPSVSPRTSCGKNAAWKCQHRWNAIAGMVRFRAAAGDAPVTKWWNEGDTIAFGRGDRAFAIINRRKSAITRTFDTALPPGQYCNVAADPKCRSQYIEVSADGTLSMKVEALSVAAFHIEAMKTNLTTRKSDGSCSAFKSKYGSMFLRGTFNKWGKLPMNLSSDYTWVAKNVPFGDGAEMRLKFDVAGDWKMNYGDSKKTGLAELDGDDIVVTCNLNRYLIVFNEKNKAYSIVPQ